MSRREVVITGLGVVSSLGLDAPSHFAALAEGRSGWRDDPERDDLGPRVAPVPGLAPRRAVSQRMLRKILRPAGLFAVAAAREAFADAGLDHPEAPYDKARIGLYLGSVSYDLPSTLFVPSLRASLLPDETFSFERFADQGMGQLDPLLIVKGLPNAPLCGISIELGLAGPNANFANGTTSGLEAALVAARAVRRGEVDVALAGGADSLLLPEHAIAAHLDQAPVDDRSPLPHPEPPLGEGAALLVLEEAGAARARGARIYARFDSGTETFGPLSSRKVSAVGPEGNLPQKVIGQGLGDGSPDPWESASLAALGLPPELFRATVPALGATGAASGALALARGAWSGWERSGRERSGREADEGAASIRIWSHDPGSDGQQPVAGKFVEIVLRPGGGSQP